MGDAAFNQLGLSGGASQFEGGQQHMEEWEREVLSKYLEHPLLWTAMWTCSLAQSFAGASFPGSDMRYLNGQNQSPDQPTHKVDLWFVLDGYSRGDVRIGPGRLFEI